MRRVALALAALLALPAAAVPPLPPPPPPPPPLVIVITIDQLTGDLFDRHRPEFTGGLARLAAGTVFRNGQAGAQAGHSFGTMLKRRSPDSQHVVVSGEASAAARGDELVDQRWYWAGRRFASDAPRPPQPRTVALANAGVARLVAAPEPGLQPPPHCQGTSGASVQFARRAGDYPAFVNSPALDGATLALAAGLIGELNLGRDRAPDVVSIDLVSTGKVAEAGHSSEATCVQLLSLDRDLGAFFETLDRSGLYYAVALSGTHGSTQPARVPILFWRAGMVPTERLEQAPTASIAPTLAAMLAVPAPETGAECLAAVSTVTCPKP